MKFLKNLAESSASEIIEQNYPVIKSSEYISKLISLFKSSKSYEVVVTNGQQSKLVTVRDVLEVTHPERTPVASVTIEPPSVTQETPIYDIARIFIDYKVRILLVRENKSVEGIVRQNTLLSKMASCKDLKGLTADELMVQDIVTVEIHSSISVVREHMRNKGISHLPVVGRDGKLLGILTAKDLVINYIQPSESQKVGERIGNNIRIWEKGIKETYDKHPLKVTRNTSVLNVIRKMITKSKGYCLVIEDSIPVGIITPRDIITLITQFIPAVQLPIIKSGFKDFDKSIVDSAMRKIERITSASLEFHPDLQEIIVDGRVKSSTGKKRRFEVKARAFIPSNVVSVSAGGWDLNTVFDELTEKLDKRLKRIKRRRMP
ncbi:MAG: CBS domain-containing protein [Candidatus Lokiarchaeota archaeon]|nr:CBS domain-containing protein [Candidatus Lokiarchaeota archaeon]